MASPLSPSHLNQQERIPAIRTSGVTGTSAREYTQVHAGERIADCRLVCEFSPWYREKPWRHAETITLARSLKSPGPIVEISPSLSFHFFFQTTVEVEVLDTVDVEETWRMICNVIFLSICEIIIKVLFLIRKFEAF